MINSQLTGCQLNKSSATSSLLRRLLRFFILLTVFLCPLYVVRWRYSWLPTTLVEHFVGGTVLTWLLVRFASRDNSFPRTSIDRWVLLLLASGFLAVFISPDRRGGLGIYKAYFLEPVLFFYLLRDALSKGIIRRKELVGALIAAAVWLSSLGLIQSLTGYPAFAPHEQAASRAHAVFNSGNSLALFLGPVIALLIGYQLLDDKRWDKVVRSLLLILILTVIVLTKSEGGVVGLGATLGFFFAVQFLSYSRLVRIIRVFLITYLAGHLALLILAPYLAPEVDNPWQRPGGTGQVRLCLWEGTADLLKERPLRGAGLSGFKERYSETYYTCDAEPLEYPHNLVFTFWAETGILGLISFSGLLGKLFNKQLSAGPRVKSKVNWAILGGLFYWLVHGLVDVPYFKNDLALIFWTYLAVGL